MNRRQALQFAAVLLGGVVSPGLLRATAADAVSARSDVDFFSPRQRQQLALLAELIIPETDTPGAIEAGVPAFIETMVAQWYNDTERAIFLGGLEQLDRHCEKTYQCSLQSCDRGQQVAALQHFERLAQSYVGASSPFSPQGDEQAPFFSKLKELTVLGYFTSEVGIKQALAYNPMPMRYRGDIALAEVGGKQWAQY